MVETVAEVFFFFLDKTLAEVEGCIGVFLVGFVVLFCAPLFLRPSRSRGPWWWPNWKGSSQRLFLKNSSASVSTG